VRARPTRGEGVGEGEGSLERGGGGGGEGERNTMRELGRKGGGARSGREMGRVAGASSCGGTARALARGCGTAPTARAPQGASKTHDTRPASCARYAGGIVSSAVDGVRVASAVLARSSALVGL
jgi:hypothetical protein